MKADIKTTDFTTTRNPEKLLLHDGTSFTQTPAGAYDGDPTPRQVGEIQGQLSDHARIGLVRTGKAGKFPKFEIEYFLRET